MRESYQTRQRALPGVPGYLAELEKYLFLQALSCRLHYSTPHDFILFITKNNLASFPAEKLSLVLTKSTRLTELLYICIAKRDMQP